MRKRNIAALLLMALLLTGLTAGETYTDWPFVLERRGSGWRVVSSGY